MRRLLIVGGPSLLVLATLVVGGDVTAASTVKDAYSWHVADAFLEDGDPVGSTACLVTTSRG